MRRRSRNSRTFQGWASVDIQEVVDLDAQRIRIKPMMLQEIYKYEHHHCQAQAICQRIQLVVRDHDCQRRFAISGACRKSMPRNAALKFMNVVQADLRRSPVSVPLMVLNNSFSLSTQSLALAALFAMASFSISFPFSPLTISGDLISTFIVSPLIGSLLALSVMSS